MKSMVVISILLALSLAACDTVYFYGQAVTGQLNILAKRESIEKLLENPNTNADIRTRLESILAIRDFAETKLALPVKNNFSTYADVGNPYVVWNVFAAPEFSLNVKNWCYPIAGCVSYRGYFSEEAARNYANDLVDEGLDVWIGGVAAYSTLGWFSDSVLNTVINRDDYRLAALIFHELAHQVVYVPGDTQFNEGFATAVEMESLKRWLEVTRDSEDARAVVDNAIMEKTNREAFVTLVQSYQPKLHELYNSPLALDAMRAEKAALFDALRQEYAALKSGWGEYSAYDIWFAEEINNAKINTVATYFNHVPAFDVMLAQANGDLPGFYARVEEMSKLSRTERHDMLVALVGQ
jgi:predicted aminopeptidase